MSNFGANFRKARETAGLPLEKIAAETRISTRFLTAIENEAFHLLPGGIFNRGFIKSYAEYLGLDSSQALADYDRMSAMAQEPVDVLRVEKSSPWGVDRNLYLVAAAILIILMGAYYFVTRKSATPSGGAPLSEPAALAQPAPDTPQVVSTTTTTPPQLETVAPLSTPGTTPSPAPEQPLIEPVRAAPSIPLASPVQPVTATASPGPPSALAVDLNVKSSTWIKVTSDGKVVLSEVLEPGTLRRFSADRSMNVTIGNAAGATLQINGRDLGQLGSDGQVREFRITPENAAQIKG